MLIVDDNEMIRDVLARQLGKQGYKTDVAENGRQALDMIQNQKPDLLLLDIRMTEMDGKDVLKHLKNSPDLRDIPLIMVSALDEIESVVECMKMGAEDYVLQPFDPVLLQARIKKVLENKRLREREAKFDDFTKTVREMLEEFDKREDQMLVKLLEPEGFKKVHRVHRELDELHSHTDDEP